MKKKESIDFATAEINPKYTSDMKDILGKRMKNPEFRQAYEEEFLKYEIAEIIRQTRKSKRLSQAVLAEQAHTTQKIISKVEHGDVNIGVTLLQKIIAALGLRISIVRP